MTEPTAFIAIENAGSMFGLKKANSHMDPKSQADLRRIAGKDPLTTADEVTRGHRHAARRDLVQSFIDDKKPGFEDYQIGVDESENDQDWLMQQVRQIKPHFRIGRAGSLPSIIRRIQLECTNAERLTFNTLIFFGHGDAGLMCTGMGKLPFAQLEKATGARSAGDDGKTKQDDGDQQVVAGMKLDARVMRTVGWSDAGLARHAASWQAQFETAKTCFGPLGTSDTFHVFFLGCATGNLSDANPPANKGLLTQNVANDLKKILGIDVIAYGASRVSTNEELVPVITNIAAIIADTVAGGQAKGTIPASGPVARPLGKKAQRDAKKRAAAGAGAATASKDLMLNWHRSA